MLEIKILTAYPEMFPGTLGHSILGKALEEKKWNSIYNKKNKKIRDEITRLINNKLPKGFDDHINSLKKKIFDLKSLSFCKSEPTFSIVSIT